MRNDHETPMARRPMAGTTKPDRIMNYIECDLAAELTLPQWRQARAAARARRRGVIRFRAGRR